LGSPGQAGLVYALMGVGSALTALLVVMVPQNVRLATRFLVAGSGMVVFDSITAMQGTLALTAVRLLLVGLFIGPTMVTAFTLAEATSPSGGIGVAMTAIGSSVIVGVSIGATLGGALTTRADSIGA